MIIQTRQQGNAIMLTVPKEFNIPDGVKVEAKLVENGTFYQFVEFKKEFFDFSEGILADIIAEGFRNQDILEEFKKRKANLTSSFKSIADNTLIDSKTMTKEELATKIGL